MEKYLRRIRLLFLLLLSFFILTACRLCDSKNGGGPTGPTEEDYNEEGWSYFLADSFSAALGSFDETLALNPNNIEGNVGRGWSLVLLDSSNISDAEVNFNKGKYDDLWKIPANAGLAVLAFSQQNYADAKGYAEFVLQETGLEFTFDKKPTINTNDLYLIIAKVAFQQSEYDLCLEYIRKITSEHDDLNQLDSSTWKINNVLYPTFPAALTEILYLLSEDEALI